MKGNTCLDLEEDPEDYVLDSYLGFLDRSGVLVTHGADLHATLSLSVTLVEELVHDAVCPLAVNIQRLGGVAEISAVNHIAQDLSEDITKLS